MLFGIREGLITLNERKLVHQGVMSKNILVTMDRTCKLTGFEALQEMHFNPQVNTYWNGFYCVFFKIIFWQLHNFNFNFKRFLNYKCLDGLSRIHNFSSLFGKVKLIRNIEINKLSFNCFLFYSLNSRRSTSTSLEKTKLQFAMLHQKFWLMVNIPKNRWYSASDAFYLKCSLMVTHRLTGSKTVKLKR